MTAATGKEAKYIGELQAALHAETQLRLEVEDRLRRAHEHFAFMVNAAYDLREPLRTVSAYCELLGRKDPESADSEADQFRRYILDGTEWIPALIADMVEYATTASDSGCLLPIDKNGVFQEAAAGASHQAGQPAVGIARDCEAELLLRHSSGKRVPVQIRASAIVDQTGQVPGAVETFSDNSANVSAVQTAAMLRRLAYFDATTQIGNRRYCEMRLSEALMRARESTWTFGVLFIDIDHFKAINDGFGHQAGDEVLKTTTGTLLANLGQGDFLGRWGGEEFLIVLGNVLPEEIGTQAERLRMLIEASRTDIAGQRINTTVSIGATSVQSSDTAESVMERADRLLYLSKREGRNRVTCSACCIAAPDAGIVSQKKFANSRDIDC